MITWSRLLGGGVRDPLVGGHLLIGAALGVGFAISILVYRLIREQSGIPSSGLSLSSVVDTRHMMLVLDGASVASIFTSLILLLALFLLRAVLRRLWLAAATLIVLIIAFSTPSSLFDFFFSGLTGVLIVFVLIRFGVLALMATGFVGLTLVSFPLTPDFAVWYAGSSFFAIASVLALTAYAVYTALAGRPLFKAGFLDSD